jgi:hypothetical protein
VVVAVAVAVARAVDDHAAVQQAASKHADDFQQRLQVAQLDYLTTSNAAATTLAENCVG